MSTNRRMWLAAGALAVLLPFGVAGVGAATTTDPVPGRSMALAPDLDRAIEMIGQHRVASPKRSTAGALVLREQLQLQFLAMPAEARAKILAAAQGAESTPEGALGIERALASAVAEAARKQVDDARNEQIASLPGDKQSAGEMVRKLGTDGDLVFVATAGPCRVADTRLGLSGDWPGMIGGFTARQIWAFSWFAGYDFAAQGGTGIAGSGNCTGSVFPSVWPTSVVATVAVVNTASTGYMRAWNGGTTLTVGGILGWNAGDVLSNTTVIPLNRSITAYPGSGPFKRDFAVYNNSSTSIDVIVDVVGYFIQNQATPLDCTTVSDTSFSLGAGTSVLRSAPACPTGYTPIMGQPVTNVYGVYTGTVLQTACRISNTTGGSIGGLACDALCCRIPGR